jgi:predicted nucleic acid-binding protein
MGFLLDTDVISMLSPVRNTVSAVFLDWLENMDKEGRVFMSVVTIHEIEKGIALLDSKGATAKAAGLRIWLLGLTAAYGDKILGLDANGAALSGRLEALSLAAGHHPGMADAVIAGIAKVNNLVVITLNTRHFLSLNIEVFTPDQAVLLFESERK